jgi:hypothetical protein
LDPQDRRRTLAKNKDAAKAEGFKRGLAGKVGTAGLTQGWRDDKDASTARNEGYAAGKRKRARLKAETAARGKKRASD